MWWAQSFTRFKCEVMGNMLLGSVILKACSLVSDAKKICCDGTCDSFTSCHRHSHHRELTLALNYTDLFKLMYPEDSASVPPMGTCFLPKAWWEAGIFLGKFISSHPLTAMKCCNWLFTGCNQVSLLIAGLVSTFTNNLREQKWPLRNKKKLIIINILTGKLTGKT